MTFFFEISGLLSGLGRTLSEPFRTLRGGWDDQDDQDSNPLGALGRILAEGSISCVFFSNPLAQEAVCVLDSKRFLEPSGAFWLRVRFLALFSNPLALPRNLRSAEPLTNTPNLQQPRNQKTSNAQNNAILKGKATSKNQFFRRRRPGAFSLDFRKLRVRFIS